MRQAPSKYGQKQQQENEDNPNLTQMLPIERSIFNKMLFCDKIFEFIELEESLYFTGIDVELHSYGKDDGLLSKEKLLETNYKHLSAMSINLKPISQEPSNLGPGSLNPVSSKEEIDQILEQALFDHSYASEECYRKISNILFDTENKSNGDSTDQDQHQPKNIFDKLSAEDQKSKATDEAYELDSSKTEQYKENYLFCRFHHLFEYEATYYSYLIAKLCSRKLFNEGLSA